MGDREEEITGKGVLKWIKSRLARTYLVPAFLSFEPANPLSYLGMLAFICFILLGVTGVLLMFYYVPGLTTSYDSVAAISNLIPYGSEVRNLHYWLANFMIVLSILHLFYLYFTRKYKLYDEILWVTGIVLGVLTVGVTYTGYVLIMNLRAMLALDIGAGIVTSIGPNLAIYGFQGFSYSDTILRMYAYHIVLLPGLMVVLFAIHFPRKLAFDTPVVLAMIGVSFLVGGLAPVELGSKFIPGQPSMIIIPEWYLTGIYALLRTGLEVFLVTVLLPFTFILVFTLIPFHDMQRGLGATGRALQVTVGITAMLDIVLVTLWGYRAGNLVDPITSLNDLAINPITFYGSLVVTALLIFGIVRLLISRNVFSKLRLSQNSLKIAHKIPRIVAIVVLAVVLVFQLSILAYSVFLQSVGSPSFPMTEVGFCVLGFAVATYLYRVAI